MNATRCPLYRVVDVDRRRPFRRGPGSRPRALVFLALLTLFGSGTPFAHGGHAVLEWATQRDFSDAQPLEGATISGIVYIGVKDSGVQRMELFIDGSQVCKRTSAPFNCRVDTSTLAEGGHSASAKVLDQNSTTTYTLSASFTVGTSSEPSPSPSPTEDPGDTILEYGTKADLSDGQPLEGVTISGIVYIGVRDTSLQRLELYIDGSRICKRTSAPFSCRVDTSTLAEGGHTASARLVDESSNTLTISASFTVGTSEPSPSPSSDPSSDPVVVGEWSAPIDLPLTPIHGSVLPNGKVLLFSRPDTSVGSEAWLWDPATGGLTDVTLTWERDIFCAAQSLLPDGRLLLTGGHVPNTTGAFGPANTDLFDPSTNTFTSGPLMSEGRWYPSNVQLADGRALIFGGKIEPKVNAVTVDEYDPATNSIVQLPTTANQSMGNYPKLHLLPDGRIPWTNRSTTKIFHPDTDTWTDGPASVYGSRWENGNSVLLPGLHKILQVGGGGDPATATAEIIDFSSSSPAWTSTASMNHPRGWADAVLLPDGDVLMVGGSDGPQYGTPVKAAELFDTESETWTVMASQQAPRMYHSIAVLLPDGRILSAGQDTGSSFTHRAEIYSPPYLFKGARPTIGAAPSSVGYGQQFDISTPEAADIARVVLIKPGSATHATDFEQRYVDLPFTVSAAGTLTATAPPNGNHAPPGPYMLFILTSTGIPSVATFVHVS